MEFVIAKFECKLNGKDPLNQASQTRDPREGPMRPANIRKMKPLNKILSQLNYFSEYIDFYHLIQNLKKSMWPVRPYFESHAAR